MLVRKKNKNFDQDFKGIRDLEVGVILQHYGVVRNF